MTFSNMREENTEKPNYYYLKKLLVDILNKLEKPEYHNTFDFVDKLSLKRRLSTG